MITRCEYFFTSAAVNRGRITEVIGPVIKNIPNESNSPSAR